MSPEPTPGRAEKVLNPDPLFPCAALQVLPHLENKAALTSLVDPYLRLNSNLDPICLHMFSMIALHCLQVRMGPTLLHSAAKYCTVKSTIAQTAQSSTVQLNAAHYTTVDCS